jgi:hypothetical protein
MTQEPQRPQDPMDRVIQQLSALLKLAERNVAMPLKGNVTPDIKKQMDKLKADVEQFTQNCNKQLGTKSENITKTLNKMKDHPEELTSREKRLIRLYGDLGTNALILRLGLNRAKKAVEGAKRFDMSKNTKKTIQKRRSKFKGMDGSGGWQKL